jgi:hypothetical protein
MEDELIILDVLLLLATVVVTLVELKVLVATLRSTSFTEAMSVFD